jgi:hypothetical protein
LHNSEGKTLLVESFLQQEDSFVSRVLLVFCKLIDVESLSQTLVDFLALSFGAIEKTDLMESSTKK